MGSRAFLRRIQKITDQGAWEHLPFLCCMVQHDASLSSFHLARIKTKQWNSPYLATKICNSTGSRIQILP
jgi:hypothetical protein